MVKCRVEKQNMINTISLYVYTGRWTVSRISVEDSRYYSGIQLENENEEIMT